MMVFEDYNESARTETVLKKVGFDIFSLNNDLRLSDQIMSFNPDIIIAYGKNKFTSASVGQKVKEYKKFTGKCVLVISNNYRPSPSDLLNCKVDALIEAPLDFEKLIAILAKFSQQDSNVLLEKYHKSQMGQKPQGATVAAAKKVSEGDLSDKERVAKYNDLLKDVHFDVKRSSHNKQDIKSRQEDLKKGWDFNVLMDIDKIKRQFAEALFRKKE